MPVIEDNYILSLKRLQNLKKKLEKDDKILIEYDEIIEGQLQSGVIEIADTDPPVGSVTYLPHRPVIRHDKRTTKVRIVMDASARNKGYSLCLYKGPNLNPLLFDVLLRFRVYNIGLSADIEKAYLQISVWPPRRDYLRFLWFSDIRNRDTRLIKYRFTRVLFGATCSQFLLGGTMRTHAKKYTITYRNYKQTTIRKIQTAICLIFLKVDF